MLINILFRLVVEAFKWGIWDKILKYILSVVIVVFLNCNCCKEWKFLWVNVASLHLRCHVITVILNAVVCTSVIVIVDHKNLTSAENVIVVDDPDCDKATEVQTTVYSLTKSYDDCTNYTVCCWCCHHCCYYYYYIHYIASKPILKVGRVLYNNNK